MTPTVASATPASSSSSSATATATDVDDVFRSDEQFGCHGDEAFRFSATDVGLRSRSGGS